LRYGRRSGKKEVALPEKMEMALGKFITEVGDIENVMFETILAVSEEDPNEVHKKFYSETFGPKIEMLKKYTKGDAFNEHREGIDHLLDLLEKLLGQRNNLVHGETYYLTQRGEFKVFRVGFTRKNFRPWEGFDFKGNAVNIFTTDQVEDVNSDCIAIKTDLNNIRNKVVKELTGVEPPYISHTFELD
jgi:hypothetical protein